MILLIIIAADALAKRRQVRGSRYLLVVQPDGSFQSVANASRIPPTSGVLSACNQRTPGIALRA